MPVVNFRVCNFIHWAKLFKALEFSDTNNIPELLYNRESEYHF